MSDKILSYKNNWECDEYYIGGKRVLSLTRVRAGSNVYSVNSRSVSVPYKDHGTTFHSTSTHYFVSTFVLGVLKEIDLNTIVPYGDVVAIEYETA